MAVTTADRGRAQGALVRGRLTADRVARRARSYKCGTLVRGRLTADRGRAQGALVQLGRRSRYRGW